MFSCFPWRWLNFIHAQGKVGSIFALVNMTDDIFLAALGVSIWRGLKAPFDVIEKKIQKHTLEIDSAFAKEHIRVTAAGMCAPFQTYVTASRLNLARI